MVVGQVSILKLWRRSPFFFIRNGLEILNQTLRKATLESSYIWGGDWCRFRVNFPIRVEILVRALNALEIPENLL